jgi:hypothetical protein
MIMTKPLNDIVGATLIDTDTAGDSVILWFESNGQTHRVEFIPRVVQSPFNPSDDYHAVDWEIGTYDVTSTNPI